MERGAERRAPSPSVAAPSVPLADPPRPFRPAPWLPGPHAQTIGGRWLRRGGATSYERERWTTPDGDFLDLDVWTAGPGARHPERAVAVGSGSGREAKSAVGADGRRGGASSPLVLVLHGLEGDARSACVVAACRRLAAEGLRPVALNFRCRSGEPNRARRFYHSGETGDLAFVLDRLARRSGGRPVGAVGYSLGGNVLLKYLGEQGSGARDRLAAAVAVSVPYRLAAAARSLERGVGRVYARCFLRSLRRSLREKSRATPHDYDLGDLGSVTTLREFDEAFTAPVHGYDGADDYYRRCSSARYLPDVRVPTLLLQSRDDPFLPPDALPEPEMERNPWLTPRITDRGGHGGFVEGSAPWSAGFWSEAEAARFLARALGAGRR